MRVSSATRRRPGSRSIPCPAPRWTGSSPSSTAPHPTSSPRPSAPPPPTASKRLALQQPQVLQRQDFVFVRIKIVVMHGAALGRGRRLDSRGIPGAVREGDDTVVLAAASDGTARTVDRPGDHVVLARRNFLALARTVD